MSFPKRFKPLRRYTPLRRNKPLCRVSARQKTILELDMLAKAIVIERDGKRCLRCGATEDLHASHIFPKGKYPKLRFNTDNLKILCFDCHIGWWHQHPEEAGDWI
jgi:5-methylcytosine-specific restriction endonuclease McrA